jgi:hypothetical protein
MNRPIIIIGAGRSGTNMLRDQLTRIPGVGTWPCDEINYIWRHGNAREALDEFSGDAATPRIRAYIRHAFEKQIRAGCLDRLVEKTCANTLRVDFVETVVPEAIYVHIVRDGRDVAVSASERWTATLDIPYILKKARYVPASDLPYYASRYVGNRIYARVSGKKRLAFWGPKFLGMEDALKNHSLPVACAIQWQRCVARADASFARIDPERVISVRYEDYIEHPREAFRRILDRCGLPVDQALVDEIVKDVRPTSAGRWKGKLSEAEAAEIRALTGEVLERHGYA